MADEEKKKEKGLLDAMKAWFYGGKRKNTIPQRKKKYDLLADDPEAYTD